MKRLALISALALFSLSCSKSDDVGTTAIPQDHVMSSRSCGTGCTFKTKQVSFPEVMKDGWIMVQIERTIRFYDQNGNEYNWRGTRSGTKTEGYLFADCQGGRLAFATDPDRSNTTEDASIWESNGRLNNYQPTGLVFTRWERLCPAEAAEIRRSRGILPEDYERHRLELESHRSKRMKI